jgi:hypothetical protein
MLMNNTNNISIEDSYITALKVLLNELRVFQSD